MPQLTIKKKIQKIVYGVILATLSSTLQAEFQTWTFKSNDIDVDVIFLSNSKNLKLFLKNPENGSMYKTFQNVENSLSNCERINFLMNAGMFHSNYEPVGLYIEKAEEKYSINTQIKGFGNFFIQPNGIFAWNENKFDIFTTQEFSQSLEKYQYATQSGPMLIMNGQINTHFVKNSNSLKIRNGVGVNEQGIYFVISNKKINFYNFANFFKTELNVNKALYLDGSISAALIPQLGRYTQYRYIGPMIADIDGTQCLIGK